MNNFIKETKINTQKSSQGQKINKSMLEKEEKNYKSIYLNI